MALSVWLFLINVALVHSTDSNWTANIRNLGIVGGQEAELSQFPYQISYKVFETNLCAGTIIAPEWIITASHCIYGATPKEIEFETNSYYHKMGGGLITAERLYVHEGFIQSDMAEHDIALIHLSQPLKLSQTNIKPMELAEKNFDPIRDSMVTVSGWGKLKESNEEGSDKLYYINVPVVERALCYVLLRGLWDITENMFCAGDVEQGGKDSCHGDSGGPAVQDDKLVGIVSFGIGCARKYLPGVYTRVGNYIDWIQSKIRVKDELY